MRAILFAFALMLASVSPSFAANKICLNASPCTSATLSDTDATRLFSEAAKLAEQNIPKETSVPTIDDATKYAQLGKVLGEGLAETAKGLGVAVNDFAKTPVGSLTMILIVWKFIGNQLVHLATAFILFVTGVPIWIYFFRRMCVIKSIEWFPEKDGAKPTRHVKYYTSGEVSDTRIVFSIIGVVLIGVCLIVGFT